MRQRHAEDIRIERRERHGGALAARQPRIVDHRKVEQSDDEVGIDLPLAFQIETRLLTLLRGEELRHVQVHLHLAGILVELISSSLNCR